MKRISKAVLVSAAILLAAFWTTTPTDAGKKPPADPLSRTLQEAGLKQLEDEVVRQLGEAIELGAPLRLDQRTAYPPATISIDDFQPKALELSPEAVKRPLEPGDYSIPVIGFCTKWSLHYPGRGLPYKLARLQGRQAEAIGALLWRGMLQGLPPKVTRTMSWRIQGGVPLKQWPRQEQDLVQQLIPEYESSLEGDFVQQTRDLYEKARPLGKFPPFETMLTRLGPIGETVLDAQRARRVLANKTLAAERMPDLLYGRPRDGLPRILNGGPNDPPSAWSEIAPGVFARLTIIRGDLGENVLDLRITPQARKPSAADHSRSRLIRPVALTDAELAYEEPGEIGQTLQTLFVYIHGLIGYPNERPAQALILIPYIGIRG